MNNYCRKLLLLLASFVLITPIVAQASGDYSSELCEAGLNSRYNFSVYTPIKGYDPRETIYADREDFNNNFSSVTLWSNDNSTSVPYPIIRDSLTVDDPSVTSEQTYYIWLTYKVADSKGDKKLKNKQGILSYYLYENGQWVLISSKLADLSGLAKPQLSIYGEEELSLECSTTIEPPEVPEPPQPDLDNICRYFPEPIQGWKGPTSKLDITNSAARVTGWSTQYAAKFTIDRNDRFYDNPQGNNVGLDKLVLTGFDQFLNQWNTSDKTYNYDICGTDLGCDVGNNDGNLEQRKADTPEPIDASFRSSEDLIIRMQDTDPDFYGNVCSITSALCEYTESGNNVVIKIKGNLNSLDINGYNTNKQVELQLEGNIEIKTFSFDSGNNHLALYLSDDTKLTVKTFKTGGSLPKLVFGSNVVWNVVGTDQPPGSYLNNADFALENAYFDYRTEQEELIIPVIYGPKASFHFKTASGQVFKGFILAKSMLLDTSEQIYGAVTSLWLDMRGATTIQKPDYSCSTPPPIDDDYTLVLTPESDIALVCEDITPTVSVMSNGQLATDFTGNVVLTIGGVTQTYSNASKQFTVESGGSNKVVLVKAYIEGDQADTLVTGSYEFVPYKLAAEDQYVIAGKQQSVEVKALACNNAGGVEDMGYDGSPMISASWRSPSTAASDLLTYAPSFNSGTSDSTLTIDESGKLEVTLEDSNFDCTGITGCPIEGNAKLKGNFMVYSRPWAFTLCSTSNTDIYSATGTSASGNGFIAAGEEFGLQVLPIKYQGGISSGEVESNSVWCNASNVTSHFFLDNSFSNHVKLSSAVASPIPHTSSDLLASHDALTQSRLSSNQAYNFTNLYWNDVGSLKVMASTENHSSACDQVGLDSWYECTQLGYRNIGRFYPNHFEVDSNTWSAVDEQDDVNYMGQSFALSEVYVSPYAKGSSAPVSNYHLFDSSLVAKFGVSEDEDIDNQLILDTGLGAWGENSSHSQWSLNDYSAYVTKLVSPNGPFNTDDNNSIDSQFGLTISGEDPVKFYSSNENETLLTQVLTNQPPVRFGRVDLDDVGGNQGATLSVPLRVEYWNGNRFVQNTDDNGTTIDSVLEKQQPIWPNDGSDCTVLLEGNDTVTDGVTRELSAKQDQNTCNPVGRQQTRVWLDLDDAANALPWLKYDWDNDGSEENPSSVVTFGIHRGNDRVIYRGEPGLTGQ